MLSNRFIETAFIAEVDLVLCFGPHFSSTNTFGYSSVPKMDVSILIKENEVRIGDSVFRDVPASSITSWLSQNLDTSRVRRYSPYPELPRPTVLSFSNLEGHKPITQDSLWLLLANIFRPGDIVLGETGTAGHGVRTMPLPKFTRAFVPVTWLSIGYMLPAAQGAALAQRELIEASAYNGNNASRTVLFIGDGSFQMTVQELSTIIRHNLNVIGFVINNDGYTIERCIHGYTQSYNDIARWRYCEAPSFFGTSSAFTAKVATWAELDSVLRNEELLDGDGLRLVEIVMNREDAPERSLLDMLKVQKAHG